jgi:periplasmic protein TonB
MQVKKSEKVDLQKKKTVFLLIGFVMALSFCLYAFERSTAEVTDANLANSGAVVIEEEMENTLQETPPEQKEVVAPEPEVVIEEIEIVDDDVEVDDYDINSEDTGEATDINIVTSTGEVEEEEVLEVIDFAVVETKPQYPGGDAELLRFIAENTKYPEIAKENGIQGKVFVKFVIDQNGRVTNVTVMKGVDLYLDEEAVRVVKTIPNWTPGKQRGKPVPVNYIVPINFKLY